MNNECKKFEGLFVFASKEDLEKHLETCEDCKKDKEYFDKISKMIQKAKPLYFKKQKEKKLTAKVACCLCLAVLSGGVFSVINYGTALVETIKYGQTLCAEDFGFPVDSYGLIMVSE